MHIHVPLFPVLQPATIEKRKIEFVIFYGIYILYLEFELQMYLFCRLYISMPWKGIYKRL